MTDFIIFFIKKSSMSYAWFFILEKADSIKEELWITNICRFRMCKVRAQTLSKTMFLHPEIVLADHLKILFYLSAVIVSVLPQTGT